MIGRATPQRTNRTFLLGWAFAGMAAALATWLLYGEDRRDAATTVLSRLPWPTAAALFGLTLLGAAHYLSAALALRGVSSESLPMGPTTMAQLAAATANRCVPSGLGGAGVSARYLLRSGLSTGQVTSALTALALVGGATDAAYVAGVTAFGPYVGAGGASHQLRSLAAMSARNGGRHPWILIAALVVGIGWLATRARGRALSTVTSAVRDALRHAGRLLIQPRRLATAAAASMATTMLLSFAFVLAVDVWGHSANPLPAGALVASYWIAVAAGTAAPVPAFVGVTEATLIGALVLGGYSAGSATLAVVVFRVITYWLPAPIGVWAARRLRRARLL